MVTTIKMRINEIIYRKGYKTVTVISYQSEI